MVMSSNEVPNRQQVGRCSYCGKPAYAEIHLDGHTEKVCQYHKEHYFHYIEQQRKKLEDKRRAKAN